MFPTFFNLTSKGNKEKKNDMLIVEEIIDFYFTKTMLIIISEVTPP